MPAASDGTVRIFISYSHDDHEHCLALRKALGFVTEPAWIELWSDHAIEPGEYWNAAIEKQLDDCDIFIPLLSTCFASSDNCKNELKRIKAQHLDDELQVLPQ